MKTNIITQTLAAAIAVGIAFPAMASSLGRDAAPDAAKPASSDVSSASAEPQVKILFHHTGENPYDIRALSWCGGLVTRVQVVPQTHKTMVIAYNTGDLRGAKITGREPSRIGFRICKDGKTTTLFDLLSLEKRETILPNMVARLSDKSEWRMDLALQNHGLLDVTAFAHTPISPDRFAFNHAPVPVVAQHAAVYTSADRL